MGWDGTGMNCYGMGWDGTEKTVPRTSLGICTHDFKSIYFLGQQISILRKYVLTNLKSIFYTYLMKDYAAYYFA